MHPRLRGPLLPALSIGILLYVMFAALVGGFHITLRAVIRQAIINRDAAVLRPVALRQLAQHETSSDDQASLLTAVLESAQQEGMLAVVVFDGHGRALRYAPESLIFAELPMDDYLRLLNGESISRYHPDFPLNRYFAGIDPGPKHRLSPVLEVLLPLHGRNANRILGFAQYYMDARPLTGELATIDRRINGQTAATLAVGALLIGALMALSYLGLRRAHARLIRANFELTLAVKASALGQITSHLMHGLQGSVAGLHAVVSGRAPGAAELSDWETATNYTERMQSLIHETVGLLSDATIPASYELTGHELASIIRERNSAGAAKKGIVFNVTGGSDHPLDAHRGGLLCFITNNLVQNAIDATDAGRAVTVSLGDSKTGVSVCVSDEGHGIPEDLQAHLFEPGCTGRPGGSGLGLAISHLLARQIDATLELKSTGPAGTVFGLWLPQTASSPVQTDLRTME